MNGPVNCKNGDINTGLTCEVVSVLTYFFKWQVNDFKQFNIQIGAQLLGILDWANLQSLILCA